MDSPLQSVAAQWLMTRLKKTRLERLLEEQIVLAELKVA